MNNDNNDDIKVSLHAIRKYISISKNKYNKQIENMEVARQDILKIYRNSNKEEIHSDLVRRMIKNNFTEVIYYVYESEKENWRIVIGKNNVIITIEDMYFGKGRNFIDGRVRYKGKLWKKYKNKRRKNRSKKYEY